MTDPSESPEFEQQRTVAGSESNQKPARRPWVKPEVRDLPRLNDLTLDTVGDPIDGGEGVFP